MSPRLIATALRQKRVAVVSYCVAGLLIIWMYLAIYPSMAAQIDSYNELLKSFPPALMKVFGAGNLMATNFEGLVGTKQYGFMWPAMLLFLAVSLAGSALAGEIERATIGLWLATPVSRARIYWSKYSAGVIGITAFVLLTALSVIPLTAVSNIAITPSHFAQLALIGGMFGLAVYSFAMLLSAIFSDRGRVYVIATVVILGMYVANVASELLEQLDGLKYLSFFYYYNVNELLSNAGINQWSLPVFAGATILCAVLGSVVFKRRDISI